MVKLFDTFPDELKEQVNNYRTKQFKKNKKSNKDRTLSKKQSNSVATYAYDSVKKLPLDNERQTSSAIKHFLDVKRVTDEDRRVAHKKILKAADRYGICTMGFNSKFELYLSQKVS